MQFISAHALWLKFGSAAKKGDFGVKWRFGSNLLASTIRSGSWSSNHALTPHHNVFTALLRRGKARVVHWRLWIAVHVVRWTRTLKQNWYREAGSEHLLVIFLILFLRARLPSRAHLARYGECLTAFCRHIAFSEV